ncbi:MAG TPA: class I SAM-dependent methyltransferase [Methanoregulaceae archaeon]|nr:class I SAM-dependent methyltransferase [Methanoregulaceae archaeon]HQJ88236.1 class I SAM-dependent methyltransferase [Methanoregulaceae archaeon]
MDDEWTWDLQSDLGIMNPTTPGRVLEAARLARIGPGDLVLDLGCGSAGVLALLAGTFGCRGIGIERRPRAVEAARARLAAAGCADRVEVRCQDATAPLALPAGITVGLCLGSASLFGGTAAAIGALRRLLPPGGRAVLGERYWRTDRAPPEFARDFPDCLSEYELLMVAREEGFALTGVVRSTEAEFDAYEGAIWAACRERLRSDPGDDGVRAYLARVQEEYLGYGRELVGWAMYVLDEPW